jgi:hypothetical protein
VMSMLSNLSDGSKRREFMYLYLSRGVGDEVILRVVSPAALGDLNTGSDGDSSAVSFGTGSLKANLGRCIQVNDTSGIPVAPYTNRILRSRPSVGVFRLPDECLDWGLHRCGGYQHTRTLTDKPDFLLRILLCAHGGHGCGGDLRLGHKNIRGHTEALCPDPPPVCVCILRVRPRPAHGMGPHWNVWELPHPGWASSGSRVPG